MAVRDATYEDIPQLTGLIADYYEEADFEAPSIIPEKCAFVLEQVVAHVGDDVFMKVYEVDGKLAGAFFAERVQDIWSDAFKVVEQFIYVRPAFRGKPGAGKLMLMFAKWAQLRPSVVRVEASMGIDNEHAATLFSRLGYEPRGSLHGMEAY